MQVRWSSSTLPIGLNHKSFMKMYVACLCGSVITLQMLSASCRTPLQQQRGSEKEDLCTLHGWPEDVRQKKIGLKKYWGWGRNVYFSIGL